MCMLGLFFSPPFLPLYSHLCCFFFLLVFFFFHVLLQLFCLFVCFLCFYGCCLSYAILFKALLLLLFWGEGSFSYLLKTLSGPKVRGRQSFRCCLEFSLFVCLFLLLLFPPPPPLPSLRLLSGLTHHFDTESPRLLSLFFLFILFFFFWYLLCFFVFFLFRFCFVSISSTK